MRPAFRLAKTHFILRKKERSISYSVRTKRRKTQDERQAAKRSSIPAKTNWWQAPKLTGMNTWVRPVYLTLDKMRVVGLVSCEHRCHLVMVSWVDIFVDAVPSQLHL